MNHKTDPSGRRGCGCESVLGGVGRHRAADLPAATPAAGVAASLAQQTPRRAPCCRPVHRRPPAERVPAGKHEEVSLAGKYGHVLQQVNTRAYSPAGSGFSSR